MRFIALVIMLTSSYAYAQGIDALDSTARRIDTLAVDTLKPRSDTSAVKGVDTLVTYSCTDSIVYSIGTKTMAMYGKGNIKYQRMDLKAERIDVNWNTSTLSANGIPDSSKDSAVSKYKGLPVMKDAGEEFHGYELGYNFKTKKGRIDLGDTQMDQGYYHGEAIKKVEPDVLFVENGRYTTCDAPDPHYYFGSPKMKVVLQDKVIAEPVYLYIEDVPVFWLPEGVFPAHGGRRSGIIIPSIVEDATYGRLLHNLGYYWAINDYVDANLRSDLYTKGSWGLASDIRYSKRYDYGGSLSGHYTKRIKGEESDPDYDKEESYQANISHNQTFDPTMRLNVFFTFASNNSYLNTINQQQLLNQTITSNATLSKSWEGTSNSATVNISRTQDLRSGNISATLPSLSFNHSQSYPFRFGSSSEEYENTSWVEDIAFNYAANVANSIAKIQRSLPGISSPAGPLTVQEYEHDHSQALNQNMGLTISPKLGYVTISPFINYTDQRSFSNNDVTEVNDSMLTIVNQQDTRRFGAISSGLSMSTKFYGILQPGLLGVEAFRHTVTSSLTLSYNKQIIGDNLSPKQMLMSFNLGNVFEMKTKPSGDAKEGSKYQLLNLDGSISYNFSADSLNFSPIGVSYRTGLGEIFNVYGAAAFDLYKYDVLTGRRYNTFTISDGPLARLTNFSLDLSTTIAGDKKSSTSSTSMKTPGEGDSTLPAVQRKSYYGLYREEDPDFSIPWRLSASLNYSENLETAPVTHAASVQTHLEFSLTEYWKFTVSGGYDIINNEVVVPNIMISRDLHCWLMNFTWIPLGNAKSYQFEIRVKAPQLRDLKLTKAGSEGGYYTY